jgi:hypothetical protein
MMTVFEEPRELAKDHRAAKDLTEGAKRHFEDDAVFEPARVKAVRKEKVRMLPALERAGNLNVAELAALLIVTVFEDPTHAERAYADAKGSAGTILKVRGALENFEMLPGRGELFESAGASVPIEEEFGGGRNARAGDKGFARLRRRFAGAHEGQGDVGLGGDLPAHEVGG